MAIDTIKSTAVLDGTIATADIADDAVTSAKLDTNIAVAGDLTVDTNTLKVDSSNNRVGIGTSSPSSRLHLKGDAYTPITIDGTSGGTIDFYRNGSRHAQIFTDNAGGDIIFRNNTTTEKLRILSSAGITFNGDTAVANALDDYEEGSWTPAVSTASTHHSRIGQYTKIGNMVHIQCAIHFTQTGTTFGSISGLPFVVSGINYSPLTFREWYSTGITMSGNLVIGGQSTSGFFNYANSSTAVSGQQYGYSLSTTYRT